MDTFDTFDKSILSLDKPLTLEAAVSGLGNKVTPDEPEIQESVYVICDKRNFRTDAFMSEISREYNSEIIYLNSPKIPKKLNPKCFIIDINTQMLSSSYQGDLIKIHDNSIKDNVPYFLIGDPEDLIHAKEVMVILNNNTVVEFERPIDVKHCIRKIKKKLEKINDEELKNQRKKTILVVDDSSTFLKLVKKTLEAQYNVETALSAYECIQKMANFSAPPDLIIIDYMMPHCNGLTLCRMLRGNLDTKDIPIVFYSGNNDVDEIIQLMPIIDGYYLKSQPMNNLVEYLEDIFNKKQRT